MKLFLRKEYDNLLSVDFVCHGVPSPKIWRMYLQEVIAHENMMESKSVNLSLTSKSAIASIDFRDKRIGWKKFSFSLIFSKPIDTGNRKTLSSIFSKNAYMRAFLANLILRPSCYNCPSKKGKSDSDITIADYWGVWGITPEFDDDKGINLVLIHTQRGSEYYSLDDTVSIEIGYEEAQGRNGGFKEVLAIPEKRELFFEMVNRGNGVINTIDSLLRISMSKGIVQYLREYIKSILFF